MANNDDDLMDFGGLGEFDDFGNFTFGIDYDPVNDNAGSNNQNNPLFHQYQHDPMNIQNGLFYQNNPIPVDIFEQDANAAVPADINGAPAVIPEIQRSHRPFHETMGSAIFNHPGPETMQVDTSQIRIATNNPALSSQPITEQLDQLLAETMSPGPTATKSPTPARTTPETVPIPDSDLLPIAPASLFPATGLLPIIPSFRYDVTPPPWGSIQEYPEAVPIEPWLVPPMLFYRDLRSLRRGNKVIRPISEMRTHFEDIDVVPRYFPADRPYCIPALSSQSRTRVINGARKYEFLRKDCVPWRMPSGVPNAELRECWNIIQPLWREALLNLSDRESEKLMYASLIRTTNPSQRQRLARWIYLPFLQYHSKRALRNEVFEGMLAFGCQNVSFVQIGANMFSLSSQGPIDQCPRLKDRVTLDPWTQAEINIIWNVYNSDPHLESMYDIMYAQMTHRTHRSIMRMLEYLVQKHRNLNGNIPVNIHELQRSPAPNPPSNPLTLLDIKDLLEFREHHSKMGYNWPEIAQFMGKEEHVLKDLYIRQGIDMLYAPKWTQESVVQLFADAARFNQDWDLVAGNTDFRTALACSMKHKVCLKTGNYEGVDPQSLGINPALQGAPANDPTQNLLRVNPDQQHYTSRTLPLPFVYEQVEPIRPWLTPPQDYINARLIVKERYPIRPKSEIRSQIMEIDAEPVYFLSDRPYCMPHPASVHNASKKKQMETRKYEVLRKDCVPWRMPQNVPNAELRQAWKTMQLLWRQALLNLSSRDSVTITYDNFRATLSESEQKQIAKWIYVPFVIVNARGIENEILELCLVYGTTRRDFVNVGSEMFCLNTKAPYMTMPSYEKSITMDAWTQAEINIIWTIYSSDPTRENMYDDMAVQIPHRTHRSLMRMLEYLVYCERTKERDARMGVVVRAPPAPVIPNNALTMPEIRQFLELREYYSDKAGSANWTQIAALMDKDEGVLQDLYIKHGINMLTSPHWTAESLQQLVNDAGRYNYDWERVAENTDPIRTPQGCMMKFQRVQQVGILAELGDSASGQDNQSGASKRPSGQNSQGAGPSKRRRE